MQVFVDADGVLKNFDGHVHAYFGKYPRDFLNDDEMWLSIHAEPSFWPTMPVKDGADRLWAALMPYKPIVLTGCPKDDYDNAAAHKQISIKKHFGEHVQVITCLSRNKPVHMTAPGDILIDDFTSNIKRWTKAGGRGIHYKNADQAIEDFMKLIEDDKNESRR